MTSTHRSLPPGSDANLTVHRGPGQPVQYVPLDTVREEDEIELRNIWSVVARNRWLIVTSMILAFLAALAYNELATPTYQAATILRLDEPKAGGAPEKLDLMLAGGSSEVETEMAVLRSRSLAEAVVDSLGLQTRVLEPRRAGFTDLFEDAVVTESIASGVVYELVGTKGRRFEVLREGEAVAIAGVGMATDLGDFRFTLTPRAAEHERIRVAVRSRREAADALRSRTSIFRPDLDQNVLEIRYQDSDPRLAAAVPNALAASFLAHRKREQKGSARSTVEFLRVQIDTLSVQLAVAEENLREFREGTRVVNLRAEGETTIGQIAQLQGRRDGIQAERAALGDVLTNIGGRSDPLEPSPARRLFGTPALLQNQGASQMLSTLIELENERARLLERRTPQDIDVRTLTARIQEIEEDLHRMGASYHRGLSQEVASLDRSLGRENSQLRAIPAKEVEFVRLQRQTQLLQEIYTLLQTRLKEAEIAEAIEDSNVRVIDAALVPLGAVRPRKGVNFALAAFLGLLVGLGCALVREYMDRAVHSMDDVESLTGVPMLGLIPTFQATNGSKGRIARMLPGRSRKKLPAGSDGGAPPVPVRDDPSDSLAEAFRSLRTNISFSRADRSIRTMLLTSPTPGDGKTTNVVNLAAAFARQGHRVLVVDADMRRGELHRLFGVPRSPGLSNLLVLPEGAHDPVRDVTIGQGTLRIDLLPAGRVPPDPPELLASPRFRWLLDRYEELYDVVLIDSPPLTMVTDAAVLASKVDAVFLVVRAGRTEESAVRFAMKQLRHVNAPLRGSILNDLGPRDRYYGSFGRYAYDYGSYGSDEA